MLYLLIAVLLVVLGFLAWGIDDVLLRDAQGRLLSYKRKLKTADEGALIGLAYGTYSFEIWHRSLFHWKPKLVKKVELEHNKITENAWKVEKLLQENAKNPNAEKFIWATNCEIFEACRGSYFKIVNKLYLLRNSLNDTTVVGTLLLHPTGIYLFENVEKSGWIFGDAEEKFWSATKMNEDRMQGVNFENPILRINRNVEALRRLFENFEGISLHIFSYAVFDDSAVLKQIPENAVSQKIILRSQLRESLQRMFRLASPVYSEYEIDELEKELANYSEHRF